MPDPGNERDGGVYCFGSFAYGGAAGRAYGVHGNGCFGTLRGILHINGGVCPDRPDQRGKYSFGHTMAASGGVISGRGKTAGTYGRGQYAGRLDAPVRAYARRALRSAYTGRTVRHSARICMCLCASMGSGIQCPGSPGKNGRGGADVRMFIYRRRNTTAGRHGRPPGCHSLQR